MFNIYMHTYKSIYMYAYRLRTNRFVVIFVVIVWKTTLNTLKKFKRDYLRRLFERIIWEKSFKRIIWERSFERIIWESGKKTRKKYLIRKNGTEYWENWDIKREQIDEFYWLKFLVIMPFISIFRAVSSYQIFLFRLLSFSLKWSSQMILSNDLSQKILLKWSSQITLANNLF
jgi:hypothetical protein